MQKLSLSVILCLILLTACSVEKINQSATAKSGYGYLNLTGSMVNRDAYIDGNIVGVDPEDVTQKVRLKSGIHQLEIRNKNHILLVEELLITSDQTIEVTVP